MRLRYWNLSAAVGRWRSQTELHERAWHWIAAVDRDLSFLQESRPPEYLHDVLHGRFGEAFAFPSAPRRLN